MHFQDVAKELIKADLKGLLDVLSACPPSAKSEFLLGSITYFATVIVGTDSWCTRAKIEHTPVKNKELLQNLRVKIKLYSDDKITPWEDQQKLMPHLIAIEQKYWIDEQAKIGRWCPKFLIPDMGLYKINGHIGGNTIEYAYEFSPFNPDRKPILEILETAQKEDSPMFLFGVEIGTLLASYHETLVGQPHTPENFSYEVAIEAKDIRMSNHRFFKKETSIFILNLCCRMNFLLELFIPLCGSNKLLAFRMMYITFYHLKKDLENLGLHSVYYNMPYMDGNFRNIMAHYSLFGKLSDKDVNPDVVGYGLFETMLHAPFDIVYDAVKSEFQKTRDSLENYLQI